VAAGTHTVADRSRALTIWAAALASGGFVSPVLGGLVTKAGFGSDPTASWRWAFIAVLVLGLVSAAVSAVAATNSSSSEGRSLDWPGQVTVAVALFALLYAVIQGPTSGWGSGSVVLGFVLGAVFLVLFVIAENRSDAPLLRMDLFRNRAFAIAALVTVVGMFAYLGAAYTTSIRLAAIQGFSPLRTSVAFVLLNGMCLPLMPVTARLLGRYNPKWALGAGSSLTAAGTFWLSTISASDRSLLSVTAPLALIGVGFAFGVASVTAVAVNTVPNHLAGMASGSTSMLRDFGFTLGPAVIGAIALSRAAGAMHAKIAASPTLQRALAAFNGAPGHVPAAQRPSVEAAVGAVNSGPLGANAVPAQVPGPDGKLVPFNPLKNVAFDALDHAYAVGYVVCGIAALVAAVLAVLFIGGDTHETLITADSLNE
jgi:MFS family permease